MCVTAASFRCFLLAIARSWQRHEVEKLLMLLGKFMATAWKTAAFLSAWIVAWYSRIRWTRQLTQVSKKARVNWRVDFLSGPVTNKFIPDRGSASTFPKQIHYGLLTALQAGVFRQILLSFLAAWYRVDCLVATRYSVLTWYDVRPLLWSHTCVDVWQSASVAELHSLLSQGRLLARSLLVLIN